MEAVQCYSKQMGKAEVSGRWLILVKISEDPGPYENKVNLKTFTDPLAALEYIKAEDSVSLVITDEVMPIMGGNALCDEVHKAKPMLKFILLTGNPNNDDVLLYRTLRQSRFYEFISKPVDLEGKGVEYLKMFQEILSSGG